MINTSLTVVRKYKSEDRNFILATWLRGLYYGDTWFSQIPKDVFMAHYHTILEKYLSSSQVSINICCLKDDPDVILGYSVFRDSILDWVFVKSSWRKLGVAKSLVPAGIKSVSHLTELGKRLKPKDVIFNPFI